MLTLFTDEGTKEGWNILLINLQGFLIENGINDMVEIISERPRPFLYRQGETILNKPISKNNSTKSFFSCHASSSAYFSFFAAKVFPIYTHKVNGN